MSTTTLTIISATPEVVTVDVAGVRHRVSRRAVSAARQWLAVSGELSHPLARHRVSADQWAAMWDALTPESAALAEKRAREAVSR